MVDHIVDRVELAEAFHDNAVRIAAIKNKPRHWREVNRRCLAAARQERARVRECAKRFGIDALTIENERAISHRLRQYAAVEVRRLALADICWIKAVVRHSPRTSRNFRRAAELLLAITPLIGELAGSEDHA